MQGVRARFTDRLDDQESALKHTFAVWEKAYENILTMIAHNLRLTILNTQQQIEELKKLEASLQKDSELENPLYEKLFMLELKMMGQQETIKFWSLPWWKRLLVRHP